jgi:hypothetical protein
MSGFRIKSGMTEGASEMTEASKKVLDIQANNNYNDYV